MNEKGFTLIELMGVIALLALIALIIFPAILNQMKKIDANISEANKKLIYSAVEDYIEDDGVNVCLSNGGKLYIKISELKKKGLLPENIELKGYETVFVDYTDGKYNYEILNSKKINEPYICEGVAKKYRVYKDGEEVYFNPSKNIGSGQCTDYTEGNSCGLNTNGCLKWYAFNDDELSPTVTLILDHMSEWSVPWPGSSTKYMSGWAVRYRLITSDEVAKLTGNTNFDNATTEYSDWFYIDSNDQTNTVDDLANSKYAWLLKDCTVYNTSTGRKSERYTSPVITGSSVKNDSTIGVWILTSGALKYTIASGSNFNIKPVIKISKDWLN